MLPKWFDLELVALNIAAEYMSINYLHDIKENFKNCLLIGDRRYISKELQVGLFNYSKNILSVTMRKNQHNFVGFSRTK